MVKVMIGSIWRMFLGLQGYLCDSFSRSQLLHLEEHLWTECWNADK